MQLEWKFFVHSWIFQLHSKTSNCIPTTFQLFWSILVGGWNVLLMLKTFQLHSNRKCIPTAFQLHSNCVLNIRMTFQQHLKCSNRILDDSWARQHNNLPNCTWVTFQQRGTWIWGNICAANPTALVLHLKYILNLLAAFQQYSKYSYCVPTTFELHSGANAQEYARIIAGWFEVVEWHSCWFEIPTRI